MPARSPGLRRLDGQRTGGSAVNEARADFFKTLRSSVDLDAIDDSGLPALRPRARRTLSQPRCAVRMGISEKHLRNLETGVSAWNEDLVRRYEQGTGLLGRSDPKAMEWRIALWEVALNRRPPGLLSGISAADRLNLAKKQDPAFIADDEWNVLLYNGPCLEWFPEWATDKINVLGEDGVNVLDYAMGSPGEAILPDWENSWVVPMLAQVHLTLASAGAHDKVLYRRLEARLTALRERSETVDRVWTQRRYVLGPNGRVRPITIPVYDQDKRVISREEIRILMHSTVVPGTTNTRITTFYAEPWEVDPAGLVDLQPFF